MAYLAAVHSDCGLVRQINQDSVCVMEAHSKAGNILMAAVCDGMGGYEKGELASAEMVLAMKEWFSVELPKQICLQEYEKDILLRWSEIFARENRRIFTYGKEKGITLGTTVTVLLFINEEKYLIGHIGDSRAYRYWAGNSGEKSGFMPCTEDHTIVAREVKEGRLTGQEAAVDLRQHILYQCVGATQKLVPQLDCIALEKEQTSDVFLLCTDGFRQKISKEELNASLCPEQLTDEACMKEKLQSMTEMLKERDETDNISSILIKIMR